MKGKAVAPFRKSICPAFLPVPCRAGGARLPGGVGLVAVFPDTEFGRVGTAIQDHLETAWGKAFRPECRPVLRPDPEGVISIVRDFKRSMCVFLEWLADTVGQQIAGPHLQDELLLYGPVSRIIKTGGQDHQ